MSKNPKGNRDLIRAINRSSVLNTIKNNGPISRKDIAQQTDLSAATITGIAAEFLENELILEKYEGDSSGGRKPILLTINPQGGHVIGLKLSEDHVTGALTDLNATILHSVNGSFPSNSVDDIIETIVGVVKKLLENGKLDDEQLLGIGIGLAGIIDTENGIIRNSPFFGWQKVNLSDRLKERLNVPVFIDNDVNTLTIAEQSFGKGRGVNNFLTVTIGRGVGLGIVVNGQIYHGGKGGAGEFGHTVVEPEGPQCDCGKFGCLETYVSDPGLIRAANQLSKTGDIPQSIDAIEDLLALANNGNQEAQEIFASAGKILGRGLANLINVLNPELIIVSGEGVRAKDLIFESMHSSIQKHVMPGLMDDTVIRFDTWEDDAWARGAAGLVLRDFFKSPISRNESSYSSV